MKRLFYAALVLVLVTACSMDDAYKVTTPNEETEKTPGDNNNSNQVPDTPEDGPDLPVDNPDVPGDIPDNPVEDTPQLLTSIQFKSLGEYVFSYEANDFLIEWPDSLGGDIDVQATTDCEISEVFDNHIYIKPFHNGEVTLTASVGKYYNTIKVDAYNKLQLEVISELQESRVITPTITIYSYNVYLQLTNDGLPVAPDKYDIRCEYQQTMTGSDTYQSFTGRIGINEPLFISVDATQNSEAAAQLKFNKICISGITDAYTIAIPQQQLINHYGDKTIFEFKYE